tara:strand:- start:1863 stop:2945 length:1083 start_codon:yes stop_codon:yes gene_type:complete
MPKQITIETPLVGREDSFKMIAVAQAVRKPILLIGKPGVAKTKTLLDYSLAHAGGDPVKALNDTFILETDESTRSPEIKGRPDIRAIVEDNRYDVITPIASAKFVLINEIDKANAGLRNSMLSVMNERFIFNGSKKVPTPWEVFCASCNEIPSDEKNSPFWDRFVIKHEVKRITKGQMLSYYGKQGAKDKETIIYPTQQEVKKYASQIPQAKLKAFLQLAYEEMSDRTLSYVPDMTAALSVVYQLDLNQALVKTAEVLGNQTLAQELAKTMDPKEIQQLREYVETVKSLTDYDEIANLVEEVKKVAKVAAAKADISKSDLEGIAAELNTALNNNKYYSAGPQVQDNQSDVSSNDDDDDWG